MRFQGVDDIIDANNIDTAKSDLMELIQHIGNILFVCSTAMPPPPRPRTRFGMSHFRPFKKIRLNGFVSLATKGNKEACKNNQQKIFVENMTFCVKSFIVN